MSKVTNMSEMFNGASSFNQPLNNWNVSNVKTMNRMFGKSSFNQPLNNWNVSKVKDMEEMFEDAKSFNQPLNKWNVSNVQRICFCRSFNRWRSIRQHYEGYQL